MIKESLKSIFEFLKLLNIFSLITDLIEFISKYKLMKEIYSDSKVIEILEKNQSEKLRIDFLNRIYTIVNFPEDVNTEKMQFQFLIDAFRRIDETLLECQLNDIIIPFSYRKDSYYLVILSPYSFYINWQYILGRILCIILTLIVIFNLIKFIF